MPRENKLVQCKYKPIPDTRQLLSLATFTKKIWKLEYYQIYVNWQLRVLSSVAAFDYDARFAFYIA